MKITEYTLPEYWASALINGDYSGLAEEEAAALEAWLEDEKPGLCVGCTDEREFRSRHDAYAHCPYASNCLDYSFDSED